MFPCTQILSLMTGSIKSELQGLEVSFQKFFIIALLVFLPVRTYSQVIKTSLAPSITATLSPTAESSGLNSKKSQVLVSHDLELKCFNNHWKTIHFIFRDYNNSFCKTKK